MGNLEVTMAKVQKILQGLGQAITVSSESKTMESIRIRQHIGQDGILHFNVPIGLTEQDVEVLVIYQPIQASTQSPRSLEQLYGICADDPIMLDDRGISEALDDELAGAFD